MKWKLLILVPVLIAVGVAFAIKPQEDRNIDEVRSTMTDLSTVPLAGGITRYQLEGPSSGDLILLIHGGREPAWTWDEVIPHLHAAGFQTLRYDMFGRGFSDRPEDGTYDQAYFQKQVEDLLDALKLEDPVHVAGYSFGSAIAARLAVSRPSQVRTLSLVAPRYFAYPVPDVARLPVISDLLIKFVIKPNALDEVRNFFTTPDLAAKYKDRVGKPQGIVGNTLAFRRFVLSDALSGMKNTYISLGDLNMPMVVMVGENDQAITSEHIDAIIAHTPRARRLSFPATNHGIVWQKGRDVAQEIIRLATNPS